MTRNIKKYGGIGAVLFFALQFIIYFIDHALFVSFGLLGVILLVVIVLMVMAAKGDRTDNGGVLPFGQAFKSAFLTGVLCAIGGLVGGILLFNVVDTSLSEEVSNITMEKTAQMMEKFGAPSDAIDEALDQMEAQGDQFTVGNQIIKMIQGLVLYLIFALIIGAIIKRKERIA